MNAEPSQNISLRPTESSDDEFLCRVYASTRTEELAQVDWSQEQKDTFLEMQHRAQSEHYSKYFTQAQFAIILYQQKPVGRLYVDRRPDEIRIIDIALLPEYRGQGIGGNLLENLLNEAQAVDKPVRIHLEKQNRALAWYQKLGFQAISDQGVYLLMEKKWSQRESGEHGLVDQPL